eukprot:scaffold350_cov333-Pavlova_lutheri.AAC.37
MYFLAPSSIWGTDPWCPHAVLASKSPSQCGPSSRRTLERASLGQGTFSSLGPLPIICSTPQRMDPNVQANRKKTQSNRSQLNTYKGRQLHCELW